MDVSNQFRLTGAQLSGTLLLLFAANLTLAQTPPDAGRILQETRPAQPLPPAVVLPPILAPTPAPAPPAPSGDTRVQASGFDFTGNSVISSEVLSEAIASWVGRPLNFGELIEAVEAVEARYKKEGYFLAQANLPPQKIKDGVIEISISEGRLGETRLEGESRVAPEVLYRYLDRLPSNQPLKLPKLERQILLINELAGGQASLDLQAGSQSGSTDVVLAQLTEPPLTARLDANNQGVASTGVNRIGLTLIGNSLFSLGERLNFNAMSSVNSGLLTYSLRAELPVGGDGWRLTAAASRAQYSLGGDFAALDAGGTADSLRLGAAYPLIRSRVRNLKLQFELDQSQMLDQFRASNVELEKQAKGLTLTTSADWQDELLGGGSNRFDLILRSGQIELGSTAAAADVMETGGSFNKLTLNASRQQNINAELSLQLQLTWQLASKNLDSSEKLSLGGSGAIPGYGSGEASADSGQHLKLSLRWQALGPLALTFFTDYANLQLATSPLPTATTNERQLSDWGISADWQISKAATASLILARPIMEANNPDDNGKTRLWLSLGYAW